MKKLLKQRLMLDKELDAVVGGVDPIPEGPFAGAIPPPVPQGGGTTARDINCGGNTSGFGCGGSTLSAQGCGEA